MQSSKAIRSLLLASAFLLQGASADGHLDCDTVRNVMMIEEYAEADCSGAALTGAGVTSMIELYEYDSKHLNTTEVRFVDRADGEQECRSRPIDEGGDQTGHVVDLGRCVHEVYATNRCDGAMESEINLAQNGPCFPGDTDCTGQPRSYFKVVGCTTSCSTPQPEPSFSLGCIQACGEMPPSLNDVCMAASPPLAESLDDLCPIEGYVRCFVGCLLPGPFNDVTRASTLPVLDQCGSAWTPRPLSVVMTMRLSVSDPAAFVADVTNQEAVQEAIAQVANVDGNRVEVTLSVARRLEAASGRRAQGAVNVEATIRAENADAVPALEAALAAISAADVITALSNNGVSALVAGISAVTAPPPERGESVDSGASRAAAVLASTALVTAALRL